MRCSRSTSLALVAALALSGCSYTDNMLDWATGTSAPTNTGSPNTTIPIAPSAAEINAQPTVTASQLPPVAGSVAPAPAATGSTFVGLKVQSLRADLSQFQGNIARHNGELVAARQSLTRTSSSYFGTIAAINSRLQAGTTPGNPQLVAQWGQAQSTLDQMNSGVAQLNSISNEVAGDSSFGNYLLNEIRAAYNLQGGVESDRDQLKVLETQTTSSLAQVDQLLNTLSDDITRQSGYVAGERNNLVTLALAIQNGQLYGPSLANRQFATTGPGAAPSRSAPPPRAAAPAPSRSAAPAAPGPSDRPLVVIRFDQANVDYEQPLYTAISRALERKPSATFTIQAVAPNAGSAAEVAVNTNASRQNAENVLRSLTNMGLPSDRVSLAATMSPDIQSNEVRVFVR
ncbi:MAG TPA: hypothetical protein VHX19_14735 [Stellaceae bacterium]|jgi:hypothetical protein|nr:hypothetical protein [Stellaceae bacterium]